MVVGLSVWSRRVLAPALGAGMAGLLAWTIGLAHFVGGGRIVVYVDTYGEGAPEVALMSAVAAFMAWAAWRGLRECS